MGREGFWRSLRSDLGISMSEGWFSMGFAGAASGSMFSLYSFFFGALLRFGRADSVSAAAALRPDLAGSESAGLPRRTLALSGFWPSITM